jgi:TM2 domain-containing membrane protein YozV
MLERLHDLLLPVLLLIGFVGGPLGVVYQYLRDVLRQKFCQECRSVIHAKMENCSECGVRQGAVYPSGRSRLAAALCAFLGGYFGIHKFYLGKHGQGLLYVLGSITYVVPLLISFIEGFVYLSMTDEKFAAKYG